MEFLLQEAFEQGHLSRPPSAVSSSFWSLSTRAPSVENRLSAAGPSSQRGQL